MKKTQLHILFDVYQLCSLSHYITHPHAVLNSVLENQEGFIETPALSLSQGLWQRGADTSDRQSCWRKWRRRQLIASSCIPEAVNATSHLWSCKGIRGQLLRSHRGPSPPTEAPTRLLRCDCRDSKGFTHSDRNQ